MAKVLYIGQPLTHHPDLMVARSGSQALTLTEQKSPDVVVLNAVSLKSTGERISQKLKKNLPDTPLIHIHPGPDANTEADVVLLAPVTSQQVMQAVERLISSRHGQVVGCGPFSMNITERTLSAHGQEIKLTPKQALLIEAFLRHPGETIARKTLMEMVWETDYMGDTRTLDVHIRWLRKIIEDGHKKPRYLQTVRGVGYRLDVNGNKKSDHWPD